MTKNELILKMCTSDDCIGVEVDGTFYLYENFTGDTCSRIYRRFGMNHNFTFYSLTWAHQARVEELMNFREKIFISGDAKKVEQITKVAAYYVAQWSGCTEAEALEQVKNNKICYSKIR